MFATRNGTIGGFIKIPQSLYATDYTAPAVGDMLAIKTADSTFAPLAKSGRSAKKPAVTFAPAEGVGRVGRTLPIVGPGQAIELLGMAVQIGPDHVVVAQPPEYVPLRLVGTLADIQAWGNLRDLYLSADIPGRLTGIPLNPGQFQVRIAKLPMLFAQVTAAHLVANGPDELWISLQHNAPVAL